MVQIKRIKVREIEIDCRVIHRDVKYPRLEIKAGGLDIIVPKGFQKSDQLIKTHEQWIYKKLARNAILKEKSKDIILNLEYQEWEFKDRVLSIVDEISNELRVDVNHIRFRRMKTRWGSCSSKGNVNFNYYLKFLPEYFIEYIIYHELCHLIIMGHDKKFWNLIKTKYPNYKQIEEELLIYWLKVKEQVGIE